MVPIILHSKEVGASRDFVSANPDKPLIDWFDISARDQLFKIFGNFVVQGVPSVLLNAPAWFKPAAFYGDTRIEYPDTVEAFFQPNSWAEVEERIAFLISRTNGYIEGVELPECEVVVWGEVPEPPDGMDSIFDGWDINDDVARRKWRFEPQQEGVANGDDDDTDTGDR